MWAKLTSLFRRNPQPSPTWPDQWTDILQDYVAFYRVLSVEEQLTFQKRVLLFLVTTEITARDDEVTDEDKLLVAASAIIPVWAFPKWHYFNIKTVYLLPQAFNHRFECGKFDSYITGMVGTGPMAGKLVLSKPALHLGFKNSRDKHNVGIHEFVHLVDMADGDCDGFPERLKEFAYSIPWFELVGNKIEQIHTKQSNIRDYGATNKAEFLAVASEYFFERPQMLKQKHPQLFAALNEFYKQDVMAIEQDVAVRSKDPCPCGSGKRYKRCCMLEG